MISGQRMRRLDDGREGFVNSVPLPGGGEELRVIYADRGEIVIAPKRERWVPLDEPRPPLRDEEIAGVARVADRQLRAYELHEPARWWEDPTGAPYDPGLIEVITAYLRAR